MTVIWVGLFFLLLLGFVSLAIDMGRLRLAREQLQTAADAGARAGAMALPMPDSQTDAGDRVQEAYDRAEATAEANECLRVYTAGAGNGIEVLPAEDVTLGRWNPIARTFTPLEDDARRGANAVGVVTRRIADRSNPINFTFAPAVGMFSKNEETVGVAMVTGGPRGFGIIGIEGIGSNGTGATIDSYLPSIGSYESQTPRHNGHAASDGDIDLGNGDIYGDARPGMDGGEVEQGPNSIVTGWMAPLDFLLAPLYPPAVVPGGAIPVTGFKKNDPLTLPGGGTAQNPTVYHLDGDLDHPDPLTVTSGYAILYVSGEVNVQGNLVVSAGNDPGKIEIRVVGNHDVDLGGNSTQYMHLYAPQSDVKIHGTPGFYGAIVGKTLDFIGTSNIHYDESANANAVPFVTVLVK